MRNFQFQTIAVRGILFADAAIDPVTASRKTRIIKANDNRFIGFSS